MTASAPAAVRVGTRYRAGRRGGGATVTYTAPTAVDEAGELPVVSCDPPSGSTFPIGTTTVTCSATDSDDGNSPVTGCFTVSVEGAPEQLTALLASVRGVGPGTSLADKVSQARSAPAGGACGVLGALVREVQAQTGKSVPAATATALVTDARRIEAVIGC